MNLLCAKRSADYLYRLCVRGSTTPEQIPYYPQKLHAPDLDAAPEIPKKASPERWGIPSERLEGLLHTLEKDPRSHMHNLLVYREGQLLLSASAPGYSPRIWSLTHSMAKTVTSFAVALLIGDGILHLDDRITEIFEDELPPIVFRRMKRVTVRHLLTMTAGVTGVSEAAIVTLDDWLRAFLSENPAHEPGTKFYYNSLNTYVLAAAVEKKTGEPLEETLRRRVFEPLGITAYQIERSPQGIAKGGWGMYLTPLDMAKLGMLVAQGGVWEGKRILPADYLAEATRAQVSVGEQYGDYDYGYHLWVARDGTAVLFNGMLGQNVLVGTKNGVVAVSTSGNDEFFQQSSTLRAVAAALRDDFPTSPLLPNPTAKRKLRRAEENFFCRRARVPEEGRHQDVFSPGRIETPPRDAEALAGVYRVEKNNVGLLPLAWRIMQNNHSAGITKIAFSLSDKDLVCEVTEGEETRRFPAGFGAYRYTRLVYREEPYLVGALASFCENEDGETLFRLDLIFPELPNSRRVKLYAGAGGGVVFALTETPGTSLVDSVMGSLIANAAGGQSVLNIAKKHLSDRPIRYRVLHCMEPVLYAVRETEGGEDPNKGGRAHTDAFRVRQMRREPKPKGKR